MVDVIFTSKFLSLMGIGLITAKTGSRKGFIFVYKLLKINLNIFNPIENLKPFASLRLSGKIFIRHCDLAVKTKTAGLENPRFAIITKMIFNLLYHPSNF